VLPDADPVLLPEGVVIDLDASDVPDAWRPSGGGHALAYSSRMDLMFSPRGTLIGTSAGNGISHLYISLREDVQRAMDAQRPAVNAGGTPLVPDDPLFTHPNVADGGPAPPVGDRGLVTIFASTGKVSSHPIHRDAPPLDNNNYLDDPFRFAELGEDIN